MTRSSSVRATLQLLSKPLLRALNSQQARTQSSRQRMPLPPLQLLDRTWMLMTPRVNQTKLDGTRSSLQLNTVSLVVRQVRVLSYCKAFHLSLDITANKDSSALLGFCLWRKKKSRATGPVALPLSASQSSRTDEGKHPYQAMNNTESSWSLQEKSSPDLNYYPSPPMSPADFGPPLPPSPLASSMPLMQRRLSGQSDYSQGEEDSFAKPEPARLASPSPGHLSPTLQQSQRSTFHLPNRVASSPYRDDSRPSTPE